MSPTTIAGTQIGISVKEGSDGSWIALGRIIEGALPGTLATQAIGTSHCEAEALCRRKLERLIYARTCVAE
ncbi:MAG: hypothetical protein WCT06_01460 [Armatimonadota bacterium]|jgi:hypothetical protein|nr:hypothetical protein [Armatimonadota bacterium]